MLDECFNKESLLEEDQYKFRKSMIPTNVKREAHTFDIPNGIEEICSWTFYSCK